MSIPNPEDYTFKHPIQMRWNDLDPLGHVNNALFVTYFEIGRSIYMIETCPGWDWTKNMFLIGNIEISYLKELKLTDQNTEVLMKTKKIGNKSFVLEYLLTSQKDSKSIIHAFGTTTQIMFDTIKRESIEIPDWVVKSLEQS